MRFSIDPAITDERVALYGRPRSPAGNGGPGKTPALPGAPVSGC